jgi:hypothetical protein
MAMTCYRIELGSHCGVEAESTTEIQKVLKDAAPGDYPVDVVTADSTGSAGSSRHWGQAIKHGDGTVHLESHQPGE